MNTEAVRLVPIRNVASKTIQFRVPGAGPLIEIGPGRLGSMPLDQALVMVLLDYAAPADGWKPTDAELYEAGRAAFEQLERQGRGFGGNPNGDPDAWVNHPIIRGALERLDAKLEALKAGQKKALRAGRDDEGPSAA